MYVDCIIYLQYTEYVGALLSLLYAVRRFACTANPVLPCLLTPYSYAAHSEGSMASRVQDGEQPVGTETTAPARPVLYEDALFLLLADGRVPSRSELLVFLLGFAASVSFQRRTNAQMNLRQSRNCEHMERYTRRRKYKPGVDRLRLCILWESLVNPQTADSSASTACQPVVVCPATRCNCPSPLPKGVQVTVVPEVTSSPASCLMVLFMSHRAGVRCKRPPREFFFFFLSSCACCGFSSRDYKEQ